MAGFQEFEIALEKYLLASEQAAVIVQKMRRTASAAERALLVKELKPLDALRVEAQARMDETVDW